MQTLQHHAAARWGLQCLPGLEEMIHAVAHRDPSLAAGDAQAAGLRGAQAKRLRRGEQVGAAAGGLASGGAVNGALSRD